jgi:hypothetical protein
MTERLRKEMAARSGRGLRFLSVRDQFVSQIPGAPDNPVGAGLPAMAVDQPGRMETDTAPSLASQLPQLFVLATGMMSGGDESGVFG